MVRPLNPSSFSNDLSSVHSSPSLLQLCNYSFFNFMLWCNSPFFSSIRYTQESVQSNLTPTTQFSDFLSSSKTLHLLLFWVAYKLHRSNEVLPKPIHCPNSNNPINSNRHSAKHPFPKVQHHAVSPDSVRCLLCFPQTHWSNTTTESR